MALRVGLIGTGRMGTALGERVLAAGFPLVVHNRTADRAKSLIALGAQQAGSPAEVAAAVAPSAGSEDRGVVITVLSDDAAVEQVYAGPDGLLSGGGMAGVVFVEASTIRTSTVARLEPMVRAAGARLVDAPLAGPPPAARAGQLMVMAGGTPEDVATVEPVLSTYARRIVHVGAVGAGTTMKLVLMMPMGIYFAGLAEGLAMGARLGLDRATMLDVILDSHGAPPVLHDRAELLLGATRPVGFEVSGVRKDLRAIVATAQDAGVPACTAAAALSLWTGATASGYADADLAYIVDYVDEITRAQ